VFFVTGIPTWGTGGVPNALDEVDKLMANAGDALLIASWLILAFDRALVSMADSDRSID
jgi:hypothetical protein